MSGSRTMGNAWQVQVDALTSSLSLMRSSSNNYPSLSTASPENAASDSNLLLGRLREMEDRQHWLEGLIGGAGGSNSDLDEIRSKRIALEERQIILEQELQKWRRTLKNENTTVSPGKCKGKCLVKSVCKECEKFKEEKVKFAHLEEEVRNKAEEIKLERAYVARETTQLEHEKRVIEENRRKLSEQAKALQTQRSNDQYQQTVKRVCPSCEKKPSIQQLEETLSRNLYELGQKRAAIEGEEAWIDCVKSELEKSRREIKEQRKEIEFKKMDLENKRKALESEKMGPSKSSSLYLSPIETERLRQRELAVAKKSQELEVLKYELEKKQQELTNGYRELEQQWEHLLGVQKTLESRESDLEQTKRAIASAKSLVEKETEQAELLKMKLMKERERLNQKDLEIEGKFNLLELQMQAISGAEHSQSTARIRQDVSQPQPQSSSFNVTSDRRPLLGSHGNNRR